jgi:hypothetical protein
MSTTSKKMLLIILLHCLGGSFVNGQVRYKYELADPAVYSIHLDLDSSFHYQFTLDMKMSETNRLLWFTLSTGTYLEKNSEIILCDTFSGYRTILRRTDSNLSVQASYPFLKGGVLKFVGVNVDSLFYTRMISSSGDKEKPHSNLLSPYKRAKCKNTGSFVIKKLGTGTYASRFGQSGKSIMENIWIEIQSRNRYRAYIGELLLSEGTYTHKSQKILFSDKNLKSKFEFKSVGKGIICSDDFIGGYHGCEFHRVGD